MAILDCCDTRISLWAGDSAAHSPGFVVLDNNEYHFGDAAREQSRLRPRDSSARFWWQLSTQPLKPPLGAARHSADLVHSHLRHVHAQAGNPERLTLAVPDSMAGEQLSLLLGVAQACEFTVSGLVSRSVLLGSTALNVDVHPRLLHVETQLNQTLLNELVAEDGQVRLVRSTPLPSCGLLALQERCISAIASAFIQQTRFDPRRSAASEQRLFNDLPAILRDLRERGEASVDIDGHRCRVTASVLASAAERLITGLEATRGDLPLLLDGDLDLLPGIETLPGRVIPLPETALRDAWQQQREHIETDGDEVHFINRLPLIQDRSVAVAATAIPPASASVEPTEAPAQEPPAAPSDAGTSATHVLLGTRALPLRGEHVDLGEGFALRCHGSAWVLEGDGALVNGLPSAPGQPLSLGDTLFLGSAGHGRLIEVMD